MCVIPIIAFIYCIYNSCRTYIKNKKDNSNSKQVTTSQTINNNAQQMDEFEIKENEAPVLKVPINGLVANKESIELNCT